ncbi:hypothetical protein Oweho_2733 [Owenweeksia hongkongensis DSM 17368]|uniref:Peptidase S8/S53 domain-containing protein n=2 Tax=Owenweeksia TaxID=267986 RepID=G8QZP3_OWEHD|nr:hypothetical protein Oweho_2733 [Owenweeksia hongkongensis DSM 17368]
MKNCYPPLFYRNLLALKLFFTLNLVMFFCSPTNAQSEHETAVFNGTTYYKVSGSYYLLDNIGQELIPISSSKITLKYQAGVTQTQIESVESSFNLSFERKAMTGWYDYELNSSTDLIEQVTNLQASEFVKLVEVCGPIQFQIVPNDSLAFHAPTQTWYNWGIPQTELDDAWNKTKGDPSIVAAFIDTGVDWWHEDFAQATGTSGTFWLNTAEDDWLDPNDPNSGDSIDNDGNGFIDDWRGWNFFSQQ